MNSINVRSKILSYLLRHSPEKANLTLSSEGWCSVDELLANTDFTRKELEEIVAQDEKGRYSFDSPATSIRANQGHSSKEVNLTFKKAIPPATLYHGTVLTAQDNIRKVGLLKMRRHYVHLTDNLDTAKTVGGRRKSGTIIFTVDTNAMRAGGYDFFLSENGVWLVDAVPPIFLKALV